MTEREAFEAWCKSKGAPKENWWVRQLDDGGYSCEPVDKAWEAWQARAQPAQAVPLLLSDDPLFIFAQEVIHGAYKPDELKDAAMRAIRHHSAVRAKLGVTVPMTDPQISRLYAESWSTSSAAAFHQAVRAAERHHGIVGKEGA